MQAQQARSGAVLRGFLCDAIRRQIVLEVRDEHPGDYRVCRTGPKLPLPPPGSAAFFFLLLFTYLFTYFDLLVVVSFPRRAVTWPRKDFPMAGIRIRINDRQHRAGIVQFGRLLHENGFVAATDGNLSVRLDETHLLVTPTCISKGRMRASDMVIVDMDGKRLAGQRGVSRSEER